MNDNQKQGLDDVRLDIQSVNFTVDEDFRDRVLQALAKLRHYYSGDVITAEVYMRVEAHQQNDKSLRIKYGVPGSDVVADEDGENWDHLLNNVTAKLKRQLDKRFGNSQNRYRNQ
ncbi:hypothetical protein BN8_05118 [Fibrisoma limi BUZ 3]|uniref:Ribosomal subunit interface protein n=1 Tax=Fibrisoma limi BUZ 3 TaxID=1185876 RepID=I2GPK1_9BACT|nr:HPF/RaiA family ribosome-associated protein [Fibrisoma limi]CCH55829.1 hypothetical protein BN8_05118 [Fibrisoma limi BUZ 3]